MLGAESLPPPAGAAALALGIVPGVVGQLIKGAGGAREHRAGPAVARSR